MEFVELKMELQEIFNDNNLKNAIIINSEGPEIVSLPLIWQQIISIIDTEEKKKLILIYWSKYKDKLPKIFRLLSKDLIDLYIVNDEGKIKMIYIFESNDEIITYQGFLPNENDEFLDKIPQDISLFYKELHDGWNDTISGGLGFVSINDIKYLDVFEWGILEKIGVPKVDISKTFYVFHNGAGGYICITTIDAKEFQYLIWWTDEKPVYNINFWSYFDAWVQINFGYEDL